MSCSNIVCFLAFQISQGINITYLIAREVVHRKSIVEVVQMLLILSDHRHNNDRILRFLAPAGQVGKVGTRLMSKYS